MYKLLLVLILEVYLCEIKGDWIDPHSMDANVKEKMKSFSQKISDVPTTNCAQVMNCDSDLYLRRMVRLILNNAYLDKDNIMGHFTGHVNIQLNAKDYEFLVHFSQNNEFKEGVFSEVNSIFEEALQKTSFDNYKEMVLAFEEELYFIIFNPTTGALASACLVLYMTYKLLRANFTWKSIVKYLFFLLYIADFVITYLHILQDEEIHSMVKIKQLGTIPPECDPRKLSWWDYMRTQFESALFENPCKAYYAATHQKYKFLVTPTKIFTRQFKTIIVEPANDLGEAFGKFGRSMFTTLPWGLNLVIFPIMLIAFCIIISILLIFFTKPQFKLSIFHVFTIEIGQPIRHENPPAIQRFNRRAIREVGNDNTHRAFIEEASNDNSSSCDENQAEEHSSAGPNKGAGDQQTVKSESNIDNIVSVTNLPSSGSATTPDL